MAYAATIAALTEELVAVTLGLNQKVLALLPVPNL